MQAIKDYILSHYSHPSANELTSTTRRSLVHEIEETIADDNILHDLKNTIETTKKNLRKMEESERFLDIRISNYRNHLAWMQDEAAEENQVEEQSAKLDQVAKVHRDILVEIETLRRKLFDLEEKWSSITNMKQNMQDFILESERIDMEHFNGYSNTAEVEMGCTNMMLSDDQLSDSNLTIDNGSRINETDTLL